MANKHNVFHKACLFGWKGTSSGSLSPFFLKNVSYLIDLIIPNEIFIAEKLFFTRTEILYLPWQFLLFPGVLILTLLILPHHLRITNHCLLIPLLYFMCFLSSLASPVFVLVPLWGDKAKQASQKSITTRKL